MTIYRQGDILIVQQKSTKIPKTAKAVKREGGRIVLAWGEQTHHAHAIPSREATLYQAGGVRLLRARRQVSLRHEEHGAIEIAPGVWRIVRQMEYAPEELRTVAD